MTTPNDAGTGYVFADEPCDGANTVDPTARELRRDDLHALAHAEPLGACAELPQAVAGQRATPNVGQPQSTAMDSSSRTEEDHDREETGR